MSHTPGPWKWVKLEGDDFSELLGSDGSRVHSDGSAYGEYSPTIDVNDVDARLIAAAPELLEVAKLALARLLQYDYQAMQPTIEKLGTIIAKVENKPE